MAEHRVFDKEYMEKKLGEPVNRLMEWAAKEKPDMYPQHLIGYTPKEELEPIGVRAKRFLKQILDKESNLSKVRETKEDHAEILGYFNELGDILKEGYSILPSKRSFQDSDLNELLMTLFVNKGYLLNMFKHIERFSSVDRQSWENGLNVFRNNTDKNIEDVSEIHKIIASVTTKKEAYDASRRIDEILGNISKRARNLPKSFEEARRVLPHYT